MVTSPSIEGMELTIYSVSDSISTTLEGESVKQEQIWGRMGETVSY